MKLLITLCVFIKLSIVASVFNTGPLRTQDTCPAIQEKVDKLENSYNGLFNLLF